MLNATIGVFVINVMTVENRDHEEENWTSPCTELTERNCILGHENRGSAANRRVMSRFMVFWVSIYQHNYEQYMKPRVNEIAVCDILTALSDLTT